MLCSANSLLAGFASAIGIGAFVVPLSTPWYLLVVFCAALVLGTSVTSKLRPLLWLGSAGVVMLVVAGVTSASLAATVMAATSLALLRRAKLALAVSLLAMSVGGSAQAMLAELLRYWATAEVAGPSIIAAMVLIVSSSTWRQAMTAVLGCLGSISTALLGNHIPVEPLAFLGFVALPTVFGAAIIGGLSIPTKTRWETAPIAATMLMAFATWAAIPPRMLGEPWLLLPEAAEAHEATFFRNYVNALSIAGLNVRHATRPEDIPRNALVLMPWLTASVGDEAKIGSLARQLGWTVLAGGEHTNSGDVAARIEKMVGQPILRRDLTVPTGNTDHSGPLRTPSLLAWPHESILNRGASVSISSLTDKVVLAGDGWWAEPDIGEWLWVGDYVWRPGEMAGRVTLAAVVGVAEARWLIIGDNSPFLNRQIIADPRAVIHLVQAASLWPAFLSDLFILAVGLFLIVGIYPAIIAFTLVVASIAATLAQPKSELWRNLYVGQSGFDERNFNNVLAEHPDLALGHPLVRIQGPLSGSVALPSRPSVVFALVEGIAEIDGVRIDQCRRLGSLTTSEGPYLMDAQACRIRGTARVLIGSGDAAAAIAVASAGGESIIVFDRAFLSHKAPGSNVEWLRKVLKNH